MFGSPVFGMCFGESVARAIPLNEFVLIWHIFAAAPLLHLHAILEFCSIYLTLSHRAARALTNWIRVGHATNFCAEARTLLTRILLKRFLGCVLARIVLAHSKVALHRPETTGPICYSWLRSHKSILEFPPIRRKPVTSIGRRLWTPIQTMAFQSKRNAFPLLGSRLFEFGANASSVLLLPFEAVHRIPAGPASTVSTKSSTKVDSSLLRAPDCVAFAWWSANGGLSGGLTACPNLALAISKLMWSCGLDILAAIKNHLSRHIERLIFVLLQLSWHWHVRCRADRIPNFTKPATLSMQGMHLTSSFRKSPLNDFVFINNVNTVEHELTVLTHDGCILSRISPPKKNSCWTMRFYTLNRLEIILQKNRKLPTNAKVHMGYWKAHLLAKPKNKKHYPFYTMLSEDRIWFEMWIAKSDSELYLWFEMWVATAQGTSNSAMS